MALLGHSYTGIKPPYLPKPDIPFFSDIPIVGKMLFQHDIIVYFSIISVVAVWYLFQKTKVGLIIKAVGENQESAHALGYNVIRTRVIAILVGGFAGLAGGYLSLVRVPQWTEGMMAGAGWIALACRWFFRLETLSNYWCLYFWRLYYTSAESSSNWHKLSVALLSMTPYIVTIIALVLISTGKGRIGTSTPGSLGKVFMKVR